MGSKTSLLFFYRYSYFHTRPQSYINEKPNHTCIIGAIEFISLSVYYRNRSSLPFIHYCILHYIIIDSYWFPLNTSDGLESVTYCFTTFHKNYFDICRVFLGFPTLSVNVLDMTWCISIFYIVFSVYFPSSFSFNFMAYVTATLTFFVVDHFK